MMLLCFLRKRRLGLFLPFILVLRSFLACWAALTPLLAALAASSFSCLTSSGSRCTYAQANSWVDVIDQVRHLSGHLLLVYIIVSWAGYNVRVAASPASPALTLVAPEPSCMLHGQHGQTPTSEFGLRGVCTGLEASDVALLLLLLLLLLPRLQRAAPRCKGS